MDIDFLARKINLQGGGSNHSLDLMADLLAERGHNVRVITLDSQENVITKETSYQVIDEIDNWLPTQILRSKLVHRTLKKYDPDVFHIFNPNLHMGAGMYEFDSEIPVVGRLNTYNMFCTNPSKMHSECYQSCGTWEKFRHDRSKTIKKFLKIPLYMSGTHIEPRLSNTLEQFFAITPAVKRIYTSIGLSPNKITVIPNLYEPGFGSSKPETPNTGTRLLTVNRLKDLKGIDMLIDAVNGTNLTLDIVGDGPMRGELERRAAQTSADITFHGWQPHDELSGHYEEADIFVYPSKLPEPFGRSLLEALQHGLPAVVSDIGGPPWVIGDAGITFEARNTEDLKAALLRITGSDGVYKKCQQSCKKRLENFNPNRIISKLESEYDRIIDN